MKSPYKFWHIREMAVYWANPPIGEVIKDSTHIYTQFVCSSQLCYSALYRFAGIVPIQRPSMNFIPETGKGMWIILLGHVLLCDRSLHNRGRWLSLCTGTLPPLLQTYGYFTLPQYLFETSFTSNEVIILGQIRIPLISTVNWNSAKKKQSETFRIWLRCYTKISK